MGHRLYSPLRKGRDTSPEVIDGMAAVMKCKRFIMGALKADFNAQVCA
jgi:hypothetical protein